MDGAVAGAATAREVHVLPDDGLAGARPSCGRRSVLGVGAGAQGGSKVAEYRSAAAFAV